MSNTIEGVHFKFLKHNLGLNEYVSNWGVLSESGRKPIRIFIFHQMIKFLSHLQESESSLLQEALKVNMNLSGIGFRSWASYISQILESVQFEAAPNDLEDSIAGHLGTIRSKFDNTFLINWQSHKEHLANNPQSKLQMYAQMTNDTFQIAPYVLCVTNYKIRNSICRFRLSAHNLPIETMRYLKIPRNLRFCPFCCSCVGDEKHYFLDCQNPNIALSRSKLFSHPLISNSLTTNTDNLQEQLISFFRHTDPTVLLEIGKHIMTIESEFKA